MKTIETEYFGDIETPEQLEELFKSHEAEDGEPAVYCGTYAKYNAGSLRGMWIGLSGFSEWAEFIEFCRLLHRDEPDPELMFQDYMNFPREFYGECMGEKDFDSIKEYVELCEKYDADAVEAFIRIGGDLSEFEDRYVGKYDSQWEFGEQIICDMGINLDEIPDIIKWNINYEGIARDLFICDYEWAEGGYVFTR